MIDVARVGHSGEVALPRRVRHAFGVQPGDELLVTVADGRLILERRARRLATYLDALSTRDD